MNTVYIYSTPLILLSGAALFAWIISGQRLRTPCLSAGDLLALPFARLYTLMLLIGCRVFRCVEFLVPHFEGEFGEQPSGPQLSRRPHHATM